MNQLGIFLVFLSGALVTQIPVSKSSTVGPSTVALTAGVNRSWTAHFPFVHDGGGSDPVVRMRAGAEVTVPVRQRFALQYGATYSQAGMIYLGSFDVGPLQDRWELDYLEFSVLGRMRLPDESKQVGLHLLTGPALALPIACRTGRKAAHRLGACGSRSPGWNVLLSGGAGVDARMNERLGATVGFLYGLGMRGPWLGGHLRILSLRGGLVYRIP